MVTTWIRTCAAAAARRMVILSNFLVSPDLLKLRSMVGIDLRSTFPQEYYYGHQAQQYVFSRIFPIEATTPELYEQVGRPVVTRTFEG